MWFTPLYRFGNHGNRLRTCYCHNQVASTYQRWGRGGNQPVRLSKSFCAHLFSYFHCCDPLYSSLMQFRKQMWNGAVCILQRSFAVTIISSKRSGHFWYRNTYLWCCWPNQIRKWANCVVGILNCHTIAVFYSSWCMCCKYLSLIVVCAFVILNTWSSFVMMCHC